MEACAAAAAAAALRRLRRGAEAGVVMFGEQLPAGAIERATALAQQAALLLVVGSSLEVWPVAGLPEETLARGGKLAIVNRDPTPYDARRAARRARLRGEVLAACRGETPVARVPPRRPAVPAGAAAARRA